MHGGIETLFLPIAARKELIVPLAQWLRYKFNFPWEDCREVIHPGGGKALKVFLRRPSDAFTAAATFGLRNPDV